MIFSKQIPTHPSLPATLSLNISTFFDKISSAIIFIIFVIEDYFPFKICSKIILMIKNYHTIYELLFFTETPSLIFMNIYYKKWN